MMRWVNSNHHCLHLLIAGFTVSMAKISDSFLWSLIYLGESFLPNVNKNTVKSFTFNFCCMPSNYFWKYTVLEGLDEVLFLKELKSFKSKGKLSWKLIKLKNKLKLTITIVCNVHSIGFLPKRNVCDVSKVVSTAGHTCRGWWVFLPPSRTGPLESQKIRAALSPPLTNGRGQLHSTITSNENFGNIYK